MHNFSKMTCCSQLFCWTNSLEFYSFCSSELFMLYSLEMHICTEVSGTEGYCFVAEEGTWCEDMENRYES